MFGYWVQCLEDVKRGFHAGHIRRIVGGYETADGHPGARVQQRCHGARHGTTHVFKVDIDAVRAGRFQVCFQIAGLVIHTGVETQLIDHVIALFGAAGNANNPAALGFRSLANDGSYRPGSGRDNHGFAGFRLTHVHQAAVPRAPRHTGNAEIGLQGYVVSLLNLVHHRRIAREGNVFLPTGITSDQITDLQGVRAGFHHPGNALADNWLVDADRVHVTFGIVHTRAHVRIQRQPEHLCDHLTLIGGANGALFQHQIALLNFTLGALFEDNGSVPVFAHLFSPVA